MEPTIATRLLHVNSHPFADPSLEYDPISFADRLWWAQANGDSWHDQDAEMECGYTEFDDSTDHELDQIAEVDRWFRQRGLRADRVGDMDQPWYSGLGRSRGYIAET